MSQFQKVLTNRRQEKHNGQPLWKYNLSDYEFNQLRNELLVTKSLSNLNPRDCALFYAEWWKRCYNGGFPSKREVFNSISNSQSFDEEDFFQYAKIGATVLGMKWIKNQNTLYFKTLLLQGGVPIKHITNNSGAYKNLLLKILELNPNSIDDFAFDTSITGLLPASSRNDAVYESCLDIVKAIINEEEEYLSVLNNSMELKNIGEALKIKKQSLNIRRRGGKVRKTWVFEPQKEQIRLYLGLPEDIEAEDFKNEFLSNVSEEFLDFEYKLFMDDDLVCKFKKKANNQYRTIWINSKDLIWNGSDQLPQFYLHDLSGRKLECKNLITSLPRLDKPSLWSKYSDTEWTLEKGKFTSQDEGFILFPSDYHLSSNLNTQNTLINGKQLNWIEFQNAIELHNNLESIRFKTSSKKIDWYIENEKPDWILKANYPISRKKPRVYVYDEKGNIINNRLLKWRQKPYTNWNDWNNTIPNGLIELQIQVEDIVENDEFFNIGSFDLTVTYSELHRAEIQLINNDQFTFQISESVFLNIDQTAENGIRLKLNANNHIPHSIRASLKGKSQVKALQLEMYPPFKGIEIIDNNENIVANEAYFTLNKLCGYRLMTNSENLTVNIYNSKRPHIIFSEALQQKFSPLRALEDNIFRLSSLSDPMDSESEMILEICENRNNSNQIKKREYKIKRYEHIIEWMFDENQKLQFYTAAENTNLYAVPLDCHYKDLNLLDLGYHDGYYSFGSPTTLDKFVVFADKDSLIRIQPAFVSTNPANKQTTPQDKANRIQALSEQLLKSEQSDEIWQKLLAYFKICQNNDLPFSTFDILSAISSSSLLAAKAFVFLLCYDDTQLFVEEYCTILENNLGISFHWINKNHWHKAMDWIACNNAELFTLVIVGIQSYFGSLYPAKHFSHILNFIWRDKKPPLEQGYHINGKVIDLRASLGPRVLKELPQTCPKVPDPYKIILPVNDENANVKILLKSPLAVALSIAGKDEGIWSREHDLIRRNIKYSQQLNSEWYSEAINYCLSKL